ncbi:hypothetical protein J4Q44_G00037310, partial [Coregonus suidteri]
NTPHPLLSGPDQHSGGPQRDQVTNTPHPLLSGPDQHSGGPQETRSLTHPTHSLVDRTNTVEVPRRPGH